MNLKESYRYANFLESLINKSMGWLNSSNFLTTTTQKHLRNASNPYANDETVVVAKTITIDATVMNMVDFTMVVLSEKEDLQNAIAEAKKKMESNMDVSLSMNKCRHRLIERLQYMHGLKPSESQSYASDYMLNATNEQVRYQYKMESVTTIDFDRNQIKGLLKRLMKETDEVSAELDALEINTEIDFNPVFDVNDTFEDLVEEFAKNGK